MRTILIALPLLALAGCGLKGTDSKPDAQSSSQASTPAVASAATVDPMAARDAGMGEAAAIDVPDSEQRPTMQAQVVLDRLGFTPGVVDGKVGLSTKNAVAGFQEANNLSPTGELDTATKQLLARWSNIPATRVVTIPADFAEGPFYKVPTDPEDQAKMPSLGYASLDEKLAERFHTTVDVLKQLNPGGVPAGAKGTPSMAGRTGAAAAASSSAAGDSPSPAASAATESPSPSGSGSSGFTPEPGPPSFFHAGQQIRVPNVGGDRIDAAAVKDAQWLQTLRTLGVGSEQPEAAKVVVSKSKGTLKAYDAQGKLIAVYTATMGSSHDPLPLGDWKILGIDHNPPFHYNPDLFWDAKATDKKATLPPGPNGPVGVVWIDISKPHYGIHGTPNPETIGRAESHGCVRLTNWDAARLAQMVSTSTQLSFVA